MNNTASAGSSTVWAVNLWPRTHRPVSTMACSCLRESRGCPGTGELVGPAPSTTAKCADAEAAVTWLAASPGSHNAEASVLRPGPAGPLCNHARLSPLPPVVPGGMYSGTNGTLGPPCRAEPCTAASRMSLLIWATVLRNIVCTSSTRCGKSPWCADRSTRDCDAVLWPCLAGSIMAGPAELSGSLVCGGAAPGCPADPPARRCVGPCASNPHPPL